MKKYLTLLGVSFLTIPYLAFAQTAQNARSLIQFLHQDIINRWIIPMLIAGALAYTIYAAVSFIAASDNKDRRNEKKQQILWGIIGLFVIVSIWGLVWVIGHTFREAIYEGGTLSPR